MKIYDFENEIIKRDTAFLFNLLVNDFTIFNYNKHSYKTDIAGFKFFKKNFENYVISLDKKMKLWYNISNKADDFNEFAVKSSDDLEKSDNK